MGMSYTTTAITTTGTQAIVAAAAGRSVIVHGYSISIATAGTATWKDSAAVAISGAMTLAVGVAAAMSTSSIPCLRTPVGTGLSITATGGGTLAGHATWSYDV
jgi:hypothetical protein